MTKTIDLGLNLLDHQLLEFAASLPSSYKVHAFTTKYVAKKVLEKRVLLGVLQPRLAMALQPVALLVEFDRTVERRLALLERAHDLLEARERRLEAQLADVFSAGGHGSGL